MESNENEIQQNMTTEKHWKQNKKMKERSLEAGIFKMNEYTEYET
jgi:hypothetical protein